MSKVCLAFPYVVCLVKHLSIQLVMCSKLSRNLCSQTIVLHPKSRHCFPCAHEPRNVHHPSHHAVSIINHKVTTLVSLSYLAKLFFQTIYHSCTPFHCARFPKACASNLTTYCCAYPYQGMITKVIMHWRHPKSLKYIPLHPPPLKFVAISNNIFKNFCCSTKLVTQPHTSIHSQIIQPLYSATARIVVQLPIA